MGLQEFSTTSSGLYMSGLLAIIGYMTKSKFIKDNVFNEYFYDIHEMDGWNKVRNTIEPHASNKIVATAKTPSKPNRQGDGTGTPFIVKRSQSSIAYMYKYAKEQGILKDDQERLRVDFDPTGREIQNQEALARWDVVISAYEQLFNLILTTSLVASSIKPLYMSSGKWNKSPGQLLFYGDKYFHGSIVNLNDTDFDSYWFTGDGDTPIDNYCIVHWNCMVLLDPLVNIIQTEDINKLWFIPIPTITFGGGGSVDTFPAGTSGAVSLSISDLPFGTRVIVSDPGGGSQTNVHDGSVANVSLPEGVGFPASYSVGSSYKVFSVVY